jgi:hypothetical protein
LDTLPKKEKAPPRLGAILLPASERTHFLDLKTADPRQMPVRPETPWETPNTAKIRTLSQAKFRYCANSFSKRDSKGAVNESEVSGRKQATVRGKNPNPRRQKREYAGNCPSLPLGNQSLSARMDFGDTRKNCGCERAYGVYTAPVHETIRRDINCGVDLRSTTAVGDRRYNRMRRHLCPSV